MKAVSVVKPRRLEHPLAFNLEYEPVALPLGAQSWRVRYVRCGSLASRRGDAPETVLWNGSPLYMPLSSTLADLRPRVTLDGLYRLDAVNRSLAVLDAVEPVYVEVHTNELVPMLWRLGDLMTTATNSRPLLPRVQEVRKNQLRLEATVSTKVQS